MRQFFLYFLNVSPSDRHCHNLIITLIINNKISSTIFLFLFRVMCISGCEYIFHFEAVHILALIICTKSGFREAPPTKKPSISFSLANSLAFPAVTDPP